MIDVNPGTVGVKPTLPAIGVNGEGVWYLGQWQRGYSTVVGGRR